MRRRTLGAACALLSFCSSAPAAADPSSGGAVALQRLLAGEHRHEQLLAGIARAGRLRPVVTPMDVNTVVDYRHVTADVTLDPASGAVTGTVEIQVASLGAPLDAFSFLLDEGLSVSGMQATGATATPTSTAYAPYNWVKVAINPPAPVGQVVTVRFTESGTLVCADNATCTKGAFGVFRDGSVFPYLTDDRRPYAHDLVTRDLTLRTPLGRDVVVSADATGARDEGGLRVTTWRVPQPFPRWLAFYSFVGDLGVLPVPAQPIPTSLHFARPGSKWDASLVQWSQPVLSFLDKQWGMKLPFGKLSLIKLPASLQDPGTATWGMTLLSETYAGAGDELYEETWAHENSHLMWGILAAPADQDLTRMLTEGLATLSEIDYTYATHHTAEPRDRYLARRYRAIGVALDYEVGYAKIPPIVVKTPAQLPQDDRGLYTLWAYEKTSATLDHLRVIVGDDVFEKGLRAYAARCAGQACVTAAFREEMERASGRSLATFWDQWVTATNHIDVTVGFAPGDGGGADVTLTQKPVRAPLDVELELWLTLDDGKVERRKVALAEAEKTLHFDTAARVRSVRLNPRHEVIVRGRSSREGDLDFDGETDGHDVLDCARRMGAGYDKRLPGLWDADGKFDPACDVNHDGKIDDADIDAIASHFGGVR